MPRANRRREDQVPLDRGRLAGGVTARARYAGGWWSVRNVTGAGSPGPYRCPGCQQELSGIPHVVVWPVDGSGGLPGIEQRRHWHTSCWARREHRPPLGSWR